MKKIKNIGIILFTLLIILINLLVLSCMSSFVEGALTDNLVAYYTFDNNANDTLGVSNLTITNHNGYVTGVIGQAYNFSASSSMAGSVLYSQNINKTILYPSIWFGEALNHDTKDICPESWIKIKAN